MGLLSLSIVGMTVAHREVVVLLIVEGQLEIACVVHTRWKCLFEDPHIITDRLSTQTVERSHESSMSGRELHFVE